MSVTEEKVMCWNNTKLRLLKIAFYSELHATRVLLSIAELLWAFTLFMPGDTFSRPTYAIMAHTLPSEELWGLIWLFSGVTQMYIVFSGHYHERPAVMFAGFNSILWWFVTISMYLSVSPLPAAISGEAALSLGAAWVWARSGWIPCGARRVPRAHVPN